VRHRECPGAAQVTLANTSEVIVKSITVSLALLLLVNLLISWPANAQIAATHRKMTVVDVYDAGQPQAIILKLYDPGSDVICYVLMPEQASRKPLGSTWIYDGNTVGSISCVAATLR
jgi:hypothetical protein